MLAGGVCAGVSVGVVGTADDDVSSEGLLDEEKVPLVAKAIPATVNIITIKTTKNIMPREELILCSVVPREAYGFCCLYGGELPPLGD